MLKNQNGIPRCPGSCGCGECALCSGCNMGGEESMTYAEGVKALGGAPIAYAYMPDQSFRLMYSAKDALKHGTLFEELYLPMEVYKNG